MESRFDVLVMNPPYQGPITNTSTKGSSSRGSCIWKRFVELSLSLCNDDGYICAVHPQGWRKPDSNLYSVMTDLNIIHIEMFDKKVGVKTFGCATYFDWYILQKSKYSGKTNIKLIDGLEQTIDLREFPFLPSCNLEKVFTLFAKGDEEKCEVLYSYFFHETRKPWMSEEKCEVLFSRSAYGSDKHWMREIESEKFVYPCVHSTTKEKVRYWYSSTNQNGFFGIPKIIFGESGGDTGIFNAIVDAEGAFGVTQHAMAIPISSKDEGEQIKKALESESFKKILKHSLKWSNFRIDWKLFTYLRKDFWKEFI